MALLFEDIIGQQNGTQTVIKIFDDGTYTVDGGSPQPHTPAMLQRIVSQQETMNEIQLLRAAEDALAINGTFLDLASPSNAQVLAQVRRLTRENSAIIRLLTRRFDTTNGT